MAIEVLGVALPGKSGPDTVDEIVSQFTSLRAKLRVAVERCDKENAEHLAEIERRQARINEREQAKTTAQHVMGKLSEIIGDDK